MPNYAIVGIAVAILLVGAAVILIATRGQSDGQHGRLPAPPSVENMGYGVARWRREEALWRGVLRRLEIQARHQSPVSESLQRQIEDARRHIEEAERQSRTASRS